VLGRENETLILPFLIIFAIFSVVPFNIIGSPTYRLAKCLAKKLKSLVGHTSSFIRDSTKMVEAIRDMKIEEDLLVSFDVVLLFTKNPGG
jgi:hypothetical protein